MKKMIIFTVLLLAAFTGLSAQQSPPEMCLAIQISTREEGLYATHPTHPFGTSLLITNMMNETQLEVLVGGRPNNNVGAIIEICELAGGFLGMDKGVLTQVKVEVLAKPIVQPAMRSRLSVNQTGLALAQNTGDELAAFHPSIPINARVNMTNIANGRSVTVTIKGRIQANRDRIVEISAAAAQALGIRNSGEIRLETVQ
ncbi:MAG: hypothetical protein LBH07_02465 [Treponema sp.]|jgi:rare lipoprotein A (peptidoglycan hydrolase)|nr:hypothetical protein [Treponema sp.]